MDTPTLHTDRLLLNAFEERDAPALFGYRSLEEVVRFQTFEPKCLEDADAFIRRGLATEFGEADTWAQLAVRLKGSGALVGDVGIFFLGEGMRQVEIGFTVAPACQGQGLGTEAVRAVLDFLFGTLAIHRVAASVDPRNGPSMGLLKRVGMRQEAHFRESLRFRGEWVDDVVWAVLRGDWLEGKLGEG
jgi:RimJ/RimL family protein N-acetyltransferase